MTTVCITVHQDLTFSWIDPKHGTVIDRASVIPDHIWRSCTTDEGRRVTRRITMLRQRRGGVEVHGDIMRHGLTQGQARKLLDAKRALKRVEKADLRGRIAALRGAA